MLSVVVLNVVAPSKTTLFVVLKLTLIRMFKNVLARSVAGATTFSIMTLNITTLSIEKISILGFFATLSINDIQHK